MYFDPTFYTRYDSVGRETHNVVINIIGSKEDQPLLISIFVRRHLSVLLFPVTNWIDTIVKFAGSPSIGK